jgi:hypothetical protein
MVVYTAIFNNYDSLKVPFVDPGFDYICFSDKDLKSDVWQVRKIPSIPKIDRKIKILPHQYLPEYDYSVWIDASVTLKSSLAGFIDYDFEMMIAKHLDRDCIYQEAKICKQLKKDHADIIDAQMSKYKSMGYPERNGLTANTVLFRKNTPAVNTFMNLWWDQVWQFSKRDQLSFNYILWKYPLNIKYFSQKVIKNSEYFHWNGQHK